MGKLRNFLKSGLIYHLRQVIDEIDAPELIIP